MADLEGPAIHPTRANSKREVEPEKVPYCAAIRDAWSFDVAGAHRQEDRPDLEAAVVQEPYIGRGLSCSRVLGNPGVRRENRQPSSDTPRTLSSAPA